MKIVDANVLLYSVNERADYHAESRTWLAAALHGRQGIGFSWLVIVAFLRLATHPAVLEKPLDVERADRVMRTWLAARAAVVLSPGPGHLARLTRLAAQLGGGNRTNDAHLAALSLEHDGEVVTFDRDFGRFEGVRWSTPSSATL